MSNKARILKCYRAPPVHVLDNCSIDGIDFNEDINSHYKGINAAEVSSNDNAGASAENFRPLKESQLTQFS